MNFRILTLSISLICMVSITLTGCKGESENPAGMNDGCTYRFNSDESKVKWTAYKFTEKSGVGGSFEEYTISGTQEASDPIGVIKNASITIQTGSVETGVDDRDKKISESFFGTMTGSTIEGKITEVKNSSGKLLISMNGQEHEIPVQFKVEGNTVALTGAIDVNTWGAGDSLAALNKVCELLHTGSDGVSKLWPNVDLEASAKLTADCDS